jgi:AraC-like DNA-binding protein
MRAQFEKIPKDPAASFRVAERRLARFDAPWHFHPEIELTCILESRGRRFVGDSIEPYCEGEVVLLGPNLPHFWHTDDDDRRRIRAHSLVVQFTSDFLGDRIWSCPEFLSIRRMLDRAVHGLNFSPNRAKRASEMLRELPRLKGVVALSLLLETLDWLARDRKAQCLASLSFCPVPNRHKEARLARVFEYAAKNFRAKVTLAELAKVASMSEAGFSRYFQRATGRSLTVFLNDLRISHACQLLRDTSRTVLDISVESGYPTLTNFNRRFRDQTNLTPREYRNAFVDSASGGSTGLFPFS